MTGRTSSRASVPALLSSGPRRGGIVALAGASLLLLLPLFGGGACGLLRRGPSLDYAFSQPLFNEAHAFSEAPRQPRTAPRAAARPSRRTKPATPTRTVTGRGAEPATVSPSVPASITAPSPFVPGSAPALEPAGGRRPETLAAARRLLGMRDAFDARGFLHHILQVGDVRLPGIKTKPEIREVYRALRAEHLTYDRKDPRAGDLVFFHNTTDLNGDGRQNDWYSLVGVIESVGDGGTIAMILPVDGEVSRRVMNLRHPEVRRLESSGAILNDVLRQKRLDDPPYAQYLSGELYAGFAALP